MASVATRQVRIPRRPPAPTPSPAPTEPPASTAPSAGFRANSAGGARAWRLFLVLAGGLALFFFTFLGLVLGSPDAGVRGDPAVYAFLGIVPLVFGGIGWFLTLGRAPRGARQGEGELVVIERTGRLRTFLEPVRARRVARYGESLLAPEPTEVVEVSGVTGSKRVYLVGRDFFSGTE